jgi:pantothenate kinase-related protein Tda10
MLFTSAHADRAKALLTLELLEKNPAGIGDHSTDDFYKNAEEALTMLVEADDRLEAIEKYLEIKKQVI